MHFMNNSRFQLFEKVINSINIDVLEHGHLFGDFNWKYYNISSPFNRLYFVLSGEGYIENTESRILLEPGNMYLIPAHSTYNYICNDRIEKFYIHMHTEVFHGCDLFGGLKECRNFAFNKALMEKFIDKVESNKIEDMFFCKAFLFEMVSIFLNDISDKIIENIEISFKYRSFYRFVSEKCNAELTIKQICEYLNIGESSLEKCFKKDTGSTVKNYINSSLLRIAKEKLLLTNLHVKEIAYTLKFSDEFYFSRYFKRNTGFSPREYRKCNRIS
jgi:AraC-like DNA-binding protein